MYKVFVQHCWAIIKQSFLLLIINSYKIREENKMGEKGKLLVAQNQYLKVGIHIGTKFKTNYMDRFIYKTRPDGLSVLNLQKIDERLKILANFLANYEPEDIMVVCRRENGWKAVKKLGELTGMNVIPGRYPPGILTNPKLDKYTEAKVILITDAWPDRNAVNDGITAGIPIVALCDTNNQANNIDLVIPCNNKGKKSLGLIFWILTNQYLKNKGLIPDNEDIDTPLSDFTEE
ncbi:MAG: 30S ribosomal protein S2 [Candidatus Woesearchaeota archaeon]|nr:30S ribosomal protein S2 [Candidatus Woesearchaeota archaeon]